MAAAHSHEVAATVRPSAAAISLRPALGWPAAIGVVTFATTLVVSGRMLVVDALMDLYSGRLIVAHGLPHVDTLTVAGRGHRWVDQQWLAQAVLYELSRTIGWYGPALLCAAAVGLAVAMLTAILLDRGLPTGLAVAWPTVGYFVAVQNTSVRAQTLAYPLFVIVLAVVAADHRRGRPARSSLLVIPVLMLWANVHGSVLLGAGTVMVAGGLGVARGLRSGSRSAAAAHLGLALAAPLTVFATPYSPSALVAYYRSVIGNPVIARVVSEWQAPTPLAGWPFFLLCAAAAVVVALAARRRVSPPLPLVAVAAGLAVEGMGAVRYDVWFALAAVPVVALGLWRLIGGDRAAAARPRTTGGVDRIVWRVGVAAIGCAAVLPLVAPSRTNQLSAVVFGGIVLAAQARSRSAVAGPGWPVAAALAAVTAVCVATTVTTPVAQVYAGSSLPALAVAARYAQAHPGVRVMADSSSAPALLWLHPRMEGRVGYDIRYEIYPQRSLRRFVRFVAGYRLVGWSRSLRGYSVVVVSRTFAPGLTAAVARLRGWHVIERDPRGLVAVRDTTPAA
ncbi:MAG TPA: hypothetical protein VMU66_10630 [Gaiellales bacterium]|nr:hypothetical protein [Gaiellales bacterium]